MPIDINLLDVFGRVQDRIAGIGGTPPAQSSDPIQAYKYLAGRRQTISDATRQRPLLRLWDKNHQFVGQIAQERSVRVEEVMADSGGGSCVIRRDNWLSNFILYDRRVEEDLHFTLDPIPTQRSWRSRWGGKVIGINAKRSAEGLHTVELEMVSNREHLKHVLAGCNPVFPPEVQLPKLFMLPWTCRTAISLTLFINLARQYFPLLSIPTNIFNPAAWIHSGKGLLGLNPMAWPIQVQFVNPIFDQSRFTILTSRWSDMHTVTAPLLEDAGCMIRAFTWLKEDETSPHPELTTNMGGGSNLLGKAFQAFDKLSRPTRNCIVMAVEDKSGTTGPTGTLVDGFLKLATKTADDLLTESIVPLLPGDLGRTSDYYEGSSNTIPFIQKLTMTAPARPWVIFRDGEYSGIVESQRSLHSATAKTIMTGGKSPGWVNATQTFLIKYALSQLSELLMAAAPSGLAVTQLAYEQPGTPGLEELYQGYLDDTLLAYQRFTDPIRAMRMGDFAFLEHFEQGSGSAYTVSGILSLRTGHWKTRAYSSFQTTVRQDAPYCLDLDYTLGDRLGFQMGSVVHVDQCTAYRRSYDQANPMKIELSIGRDVEEEDPVARATRTLSQIWNLVGVFFGSQDLF